MQELEYRKKIADNNIVGYISLLSPHKLDCCSGHYLLTAITLFFSLPSSLFPPLFLPLPPSPQLPLLDGVLNSSDAHFWQQGNGSVVGSIHIQVCS